MGATRDRLDIIELIHRYAALIDLKQYDDIDRVFTKDAVANYASMRAFVGDDYEPKGRDDIRRWLQQYTGGRSGMHFMHNHVVELDGDRASMRNYLHNTNSSITGMYYTQLRRTKDGWRIRELRLEERFVDASAVPGPLPATSQS
jgi:ketosteroid isomerase-like protein